MAYGFQAINQSDFVQIDQDYTNWVVAMRGNFAYNGAAAHKIMITDYGVFPMIFMRNPTGYYVSLNELKLASYGWSESSIAFYIFNAPVGTVFEYMLCYPATSLPTPTPTYGLRVYRDNGAIAFDSMSEGPRISAIYSANLPAQRNAVGYLNYYPANSNPWILLNGLVGTNSIAIEGTTGYNIHCGVRLYDPNTIQLLMVDRGIASQNMSGSNPDIGVVSAVLANAE